MKKIILFIAIFSATLFNGCDYLDIVPDDTATINDAFKNETTAENFIYACYSFIPQYNNCRTNFGWLMSNETVCSKHWGLQWFSFLQMQQAQYSASEPVLDIWQQCYSGIRQCYIFLNNIDKVTPLIIQPAEYAAKKKVWIAEAKFLIAYFHSILIQHYGPIVVVDKEIPLDGQGDDFFRSRKPYDECVKEVASMFDDAMTDLPTTVQRNDYGRATKVIAQSLKARMYMFAASPLYNGNSEFYADFKNEKTGEQLISQTYDKEKWKKAMDESLLAITMAEQVGLDLYKYNSPKPLSDFDQAVANQRYTMIDPWNKELIWGYSSSKETTNQNYFQVLVMPKGFCPRGGAPIGGIGPSLTAVEFLYSKNGLPCDQDPAYDWTNRMAILPGDSTIYLHRDREPRFYAYIGYDRGPYEINGDTVSLHIRFGEQNGVVQADLNADHLYSGYALKKGVRTDNQALSSGTLTINTYPYPIIRLGELYMNYAEACAEYTGTLDGNATKYFNAIRQKAGLNDLKTSFGVPTGSKLIEIVRRERMNEFIFEAQWLYDLKRWKTAETFFKADANGMRGLTSAGKTAEDFYKARVLPERPITFSQKQYLYPIKQTYIDINANLVQNPGW